MGGNNMNKKIWLSSPHMSDEGFEMDFIKQAFSANWIAPLGSNVDGFEQDIIEKVGTSHAAAMVSGTSAIHMALKAAGVGTGDFVLCSTLTFAATANPILYEGAVPVFIDSNLETWNMDPRALKKAFLKYGKKIKAVLVVHLYGLSADMDPILNICREYGVPVIEDAAESLGSTYKGKATGSLGDFGIFSFNGNKIITTSGGGMLVSNSAERIEKVKFWITQSKDPANCYQHSEIGYNYRMSNVVAGIGRGQMKVLDARIAQKRHIYEFYKRELEPTGLITMMPVNAWNEPNYWLSAALLNDDIEPADMMNRLQKQNIDSRLLWKPMHRQPLFAGYDFVGEGVSDYLFARGLCLPSDTKTTDDELDQVCSIVKKICAEQCLQPVRTSGLTQQHHFLSP